MKQHQIRMATDKDYNDLLNLWKYCFTDSDSFRKWYFEHYYYSSETIVIDVDGRAVASLQVVDLPMLINGKRLKTGYIVGVDCLPEYRGRGFTRQLIEEAINHYAPQHNIQLLQLMPFEADFYYPFGFVFGNYHANIALNIDEFYHPEYREMARKYSWKDVDLNCFRENIQLLEAVYKNCMKKYDGYVERVSDRRWAALLDDMRMENGYMKILYNQFEEAVGYIVYGFIDNHLYIRECIVTDNDARQAMYYFISTHRSQYKTVEWSAAENEPVIYRRKKDKTGVQWYPFMMYRIVDPTIISVFASDYPKQDIRFFVENKGTYLWRAHGDLIEKIADRCETDVKLSVQVLTQVVFDYASEAISVENEKSCAGIEQLRHLFKEKKIVFNNEYF